MLVVINTITNEERMKENNTNVQMRRKTNVIFSALLVWVDDVTPDCVCVCHAMPCHC